MEVTLVSHYFDTSIRGIGSYSQLIYNSLRQRGLTLNKITIDDMLFPPSYPLAYPFYITFDLKRILLKKKFKNTDIFHSLNPLQSLHIPKRNGVSSVLDFIPLYEKNTFYDRMYGKLFNKCIKSSVECERIIALNSDVKKTLISNYNAEESKIEIIPPAIDQKYYPTNKKHDLFTIGTVSTLCERKRVNILVKSFLEADIENSKLLIGGDGPEIEKLKKIVNNDNRVEFLGFVHDDAMNNFYNSLDVFVFPTLTEGYGMPIVEAMACGKPVITLDDSNIPANLKEKTYICKKEDLSDVLLNRTYSCNIKKNIIFAKEHSLENISSKLMKVYESI